MQVGPTGLNYQLGREFQVRLGLHPRHPRSPLLVLPGHRTDTSTESSLHLKRAAYYSRWSNTRRERHYTQTRRYWTYATSSGLLGRDIGAGARILSSDCYPDQSVASALWT